MIVYKKCKKKSPECNSAAFRCYKLSRARENYLGSFIFPILFTIKLVKRGIVNDFKPILSTNAYFKIM